MAVSGDRDTIRLEEATLGVYTGLLSAPRDGFRWVVGWRPAPTGEAARDSRGNPGWLIANDVAGVIYRVRYSALRAERCRDLHRRFARLARARPERQFDAILGFANKYGWLGSRDDRCLLTPPHPNDTATTWDRTSETREGEPWELWADAVAEAAALVALWDLVCQDQRGTLDRFLTWSRTPPQSVSIRVGWSEQGLIPPPVPYDADWRETTWGTRGRVIADEASHFGAYRFRRYPKMDTFDAIRLYLQDKVNAHLWSGASLHIYDERERRGELLVCPHTLLATVYLHFAREMVGGKYPTAPCAYSRCGGHFVPSRSDQRYCSPTCKSSAGYHRSRDPRSTPITTPKPADDGGVPRTE